MKKTIIIFFSFLLSCKETNFEDYKIKKIEFSSDYYSDTVKKITIKKIPELNYYVNKIKELKIQSNEYFKPFKGGIDIDFFSFFHNGGYKIILTLHTALIIKENNNYIFKNYKGEFKNDSLAYEIINRYKNELGIDKKNRIPPAPARFPSRGN